MHGGIVGPRPCSRWEMLLGDPVPGGAGARCPHPGCSTGAKLRQSFGLITAVYGGRSVPLAPSSHRVCASARKELTRTRPLAVRQPCPPSSLGPLVHRFSRGWSCCQRAAKSTGTGTHLAGGAPQDSWLWVQSSACPFCPTWGAERCVSQGQGLTGCRGDARGWGSTGTPGRAPPRLAAAAAQRAVPASGSRSFGAAKWVLLGRRLCQGWARSTSPTARRKVRLTKQ